MRQVIRASVLLAALALGTLALLSSVMARQGNAPDHPAARPAARQPPEAGRRTPDPARSTVTLDPRRITNDGQAARLTVTLRDSRGRPLAGERVRLESPAPFLVETQGMTGAQGRAVLAVTVAAGARHRAASSGPVSLRVIDLSAERTLPQTVRLAVYNRVAVLVQGLGTALSCGDHPCLPGMFGPLIRDVLTPLGYQATGPAPTILVYSYQGGTMAGGSWLAAAYDRCDTVQPVAQSVDRLHAMLLAYRARYPYTSFELIGHSLGGLVALQGIGYRWILDRLGPAAIDKVVTVDSPVNGISEFRARAWLVDIFSGLWQLHSCRGQGFGLPLVGELSGLGDRSPDRQHAWIRAARAAGAAVLTITNREDIPVPEAYTIIDEGAASGVADRLIYEVSDGQTLGHSALLYPALEDSRPNPSWADFTARLRAYLQQPCLAFAPAGTSCVYPSLDMPAR